MTAIDAGYTRVGSICLSAHTVIYVKEGDVYFREVIGDYTHAPLQPVQVNPGSKIERLLMKAGYRQQNSKWTK